MSDADLWLHDRENPGVYQRDRRIFKSLLADRLPFFITGCHYCGHGKIQGYYWQRVGEPPGVNVCKPCGDPIFEMQRLGDIVNGGDK